MLAQIKNVAKLSHVNELQKEINQGALLVKPPESTRYDISKTMSNNKKL